MIAEPKFWREHSLPARVLGAGLSPLSGVYDAAQRLRRATSREHAARTPVFCAGAATLGGVGKTPLALLLAQRLKALGQQPWFLTRGYGGAMRGPTLLNQSVHGAKDTGDEAQLLAASCPTILAHDRPAGARLAAGADALILDDGYQNPSLRKDCALLLINGADPSGNGRIFPAGPLREPLARALSRADGAVIVDAAPWSNSRPQSQDLLGVEDFGAWPILRRFGGPVFRARFELDNAPPPGRVTAFAGIGSPARFFSLLERSGFEVVSRHAFPDHHPYTADDLARLRAHAAADRAALITTAKDFVRLSAEERADMLQLPVVMRIDAEDRLDALLAQTLDGFDARSGAWR